MAKEEIKSRAAIGTSSFILIFIILCLAVFGLLSLSSARNSYELAMRNKEAVAEFYRADNEGQRFFCETDQALLAAAGLEGRERQSFLKEKLKDAYSENGIYTKAIPMTRGQALVVELEETPENGCRVRSWKVCNTEDYAIDDSMPVWTGQ